MTRKPAASLLALTFLLACCGVARWWFQAPRGLNVEYFVDPQSNARPVLTLVTPEISTVQLTAEWNGAPPSDFRARWFGFLAVSTAGEYTFATASDDGSTLSIDGTEVVNNGGVHGVQSAEGRITLEPGPHSIVVDYQQAGGVFHVDWSWAVPGGALTPIPGWRVSPSRVSYGRALTARVLDLSTMTLLIALVGLALWLAIRRDRSELPTGSRWIARHPRLATLGLFALLAVAQTWPLASDPSRLSRNDNGDTILNEWTMAWIAHQAPRDPLRLYDGNIFHPDRDTVAYSEAMIVQSAIAAPLLWLGASPVLAYNIVLMAGFALTGWAVAIVMAGWTGDWLAGILSGIFAGFNAHTISRLPHLQAQHNEFLPLSLLALDALLRDPRTGQAIRLAVWFTLQALTSIYMLVFTVFALAAAAIVRPDGWRGANAKRLAVAIALAAAIAILALAPFLLPYWRVYGRGLSRTLADAAKYSASWTDYLTTPSWVHAVYWSHRFTSFASTSLFPGFAATALAAVAILTGVAWRDARARMVLAMGVAGIVLSFGPGVPGYELLFRGVPLLHAIRAPVRFGYLGIVAIAMLAGFGLAWLRRRAGARTFTLTAAIALLLAFVEPLAAPLYLVRAQTIPSLYDTVRDDPAAIVVEMPFPAPNALFHNAPYLLNSTRHWKPMLNGYSSMPRSYLERYDQVAGFPAAPAIAQLQRLNVTHVFVHIDQYGASIEGILDQVPALTKVGREGWVLLYRLRARE